MFKRGDLVKFTNGFKRKADGLVYSVSPYSEPVFIVDLNTGQTLARNSKDLKKFAKGEQIALEQE